MSENEDNKDVVNDQQPLNDQTVHHHHHHHHHHRHHRRRILKRVFWWTFGLLLLLAIFFAASAWRNLKVTTNNMYNSAGIAKQRNADKLLDQKKPVSILLLGTDKIENCGK